jgi:hypothetical protein
LKGQAHSNLEKPISARYMTPSIYTAARDSPSLTHPLLPSPSAAQTDALSNTQSLSRLYLSLFLLSWSFRTRAPLPTLRAGHRRRPLRNPSNLVATPLPTLRACRRAARLPSRGHGRRRCRGLPRAGGAGYTAVRPPSRGCGWRGLAPV